ncbi:protein of unknown function [Limnospira indica PCC 8005]|uniref:Uncharacterized protein n=1 Tax=Limnospira indica PCC 8005 TaxID=376219 RepID=A0A9P1NYL7_9CYAN|nr:protein of unknown function [Limnospira indica PCC 8005]
MAIAVTLSHIRPSGFNTPPYGIIEHYDFFVGLTLSSLPYLDSSKRRDI